MALSDLEFGDIQVGVEKSRVLRIVNINALPINLEQFLKLSLDNLKIDLVKMTDVKGNQIINHDQRDLSPTFEIMSTQRTKKQINL